MTPAKSISRSSLGPRVMLRAFLSLVILLPSLAHASTAQILWVTPGQNGSDTVVSASPNNNVGETEEINYAQVLRDVVAAGLSKVPRSLVRKLLAADVRLECSAALLRTMRAFQNFEPWMIRLFDATGKYPTGFLEASRVDVGAFDECLETTVRDRHGNVLSRGQYCSLLAYVDNATALQAIMSYFEDVMHPKIAYFSKHGIVPGDPLARLALCYIDDCNQHDLQALINSVSPPIIRLEVSNCITAEPRPWSITQIAIATFGSILLVVILVCTLVDYFSVPQSESSKNHGVLFQIILAFSAKSHSEMLMRVPEKHQVDQRALQFFHGVRCITIMHIVLGHVQVTPTDTLTRVQGLFESSIKWQNMIVPAAFNGVDTFCFLSGFFLHHIISKQKGNRTAIFIIAMIRRLIRLCVPLFFVIMCFYMLPRLVDGPDTETFFQRFYADVSEHWWHLLLQIRNFYDMKQVLGHLWYLSVDSQLFVVSILTLLIFRRQKRLALAVLAVLSLLGCAIATWTMTRLHLLPFLIAPFPDIERMMSTVRDYYSKPFYHAVCYFSGCMTSLILADFRECKIPKTVLLVGWCACVSCGLFCVFIKLPWYLEENPTTNNVEITLAFFDRILWSFCIGWLTLTCSTGRGGPVNKLLSWNAFVPLSKLSYGVYLIHLPFLELVMHSSRERVYFSEFNQATRFFGALVWCFVLSYLVFVMCEAPTAALDRLTFGRLMRRASAREQPPEQLKSVDWKTKTGGGEGNHVSLHLSKHGTFTLVKI